MQLGLVTYQWGANWDLPTLIENCQEAGFRGVELRTTHKHGVEPSLSAAERKEVRMRFADSGIHLVGLGTICEFHSPDPDILKANIKSAEEFVVLAHDCGGGGIKVRPNALPANVPVEKTLEQIGKAMNAVAEFAEGYGMEVRMEVHGPGTSALPHIKTMMDHAPNDYAKVCWNCNKEDMDGEGLEYNFNLVKDRIGTVHIHQFKPNYPWKDFFGLLRKTKFEGWTLLEDSDVPENPAEAMKDYRAQWEKLAKP